MQSVILYPSPTQLRLVYCRVEQKARSTHPAVSWGKVPHLSGRWHSFNLGRETIVFSSPVWLCIVLLNLSTLKDVDNLWFHTSENDIETNFADKKNYAVIQIHIHYSDHLFSAVRCFCWSRGLILFWVFWVWASVYFTKIWRPVDGATYWREYTMYPTWIYFYTRGACTRNMSVLCGVSCL